MVLPILAALCMASVGVFVRNVQSSTYVIVFFRFFIAWILVSLLCLRYDRKAITERPDVWMPINGVVLIIGVFLYLTNIRQTTLATAVVLLFLMPFFVILMRPLLGERNGRREVVSAALGFAGVLFIMDLSMDMSGSTGAILVVGIASAFFYALLNILKKHIANRNHEGRELQTLFHLFLFGWISVLIIGALMGDLHFHAPDLPYLVGVGLIPGFAAMSILFLAHRELPAGTVVILLYTEPVFAIIFGVAIFGESMSPFQVVGTALILMAGLWVSRTGKGTDR